MGRSKKLLLFVGLVSLVSLTLMASAVPLSAQTIGMVVGRHGDITVFDADLDAVLGSMSITLPQFTDMGDCSITGDQSKGFVTRSADGVYVIDLATPASPVLAAGPNPVTVSNNVGDISISPDGKFIAACSVGQVGPVSVIGISAQAEVSTFGLGHSCNSVDVCSDGSVLVTSRANNTVRRLTIDGAGNLTDTGDFLNLGDQPSNALCSPDAASGIAITSTTSAQIESFLIPGLAAADTRSLSGTAGLSGQISPLGDRVFARTTFASKVDACGFISTSGALTPTPIFAIPAQAVPLFFGTDQLAVHPDGSKFYVPRNGALRVHDASTGALLTSMAAPPFATGVCLPTARSVSEVDIDIKPGGDPNSVNLKSNGVIPVAILSDADLNASREIDVSTLTFGPGGASAAHNGHSEDVDGDGDTDFVLHFATQDAGIDAGDTDACLAGTTVSGTGLEGCDDIRITPGSSKGRDN